MSKQTTTAPIRKPGRPRNATLDQIRPRIMEMEAEGKSSRKIWIELTKEGLIQLSYNTLNQQIGSWKKDAANELTLKISLSKAAASSLDPATGQPLGPLMPPALARPATATRAYLLRGDGYAILTAIAEPTGQSAAIPCPSAATMAEPAPEPPAPCPVLLDSAAQSQIAALADRLGIRPRQRPRMRPRFHIWRAPGGQPLRLQREIASPEPTAPARTLDEIEAWEASAMARAREIAAILASLLRIPSALALPVQTERPARQRGSRQPEPGIDPIAMAGASAKPAPAPRKRGSRKKS